MEIFNDKRLLLKKEYTVDVKVNYTLNYWVSGILYISQSNIKLTIYGESNDTSEYTYDENFNQLTCTNYANDVYKLYNVNMIKSHHAKLSTNRWSFYNEYKIQDLLFNKENITDIPYFNQLSFKSNNLNNWIGNTNLQREITDAYFQGSSNKINTKEILINIENMYLIIHYPTNMYRSTYKSGIEFFPVINIMFQEEVSFEHMKNKYYELLDLFYLLFGYDIDIKEVEFYSESDKFSYYYKQKLNNNKNQEYPLIPLGHNLNFNNNNILETPLSIFQDYFKLNDFEKKLYSNFKKYQNFKSSEEKLLGYFRILENIMFTNEILNTDMINNLKEYENITPNQIKKCKDKKLKSQSCIFHIKFIIYFKNLPLEIKNNLICTEEDVKNIVKLRNDITHFNEYVIKDEKLDSYVEFLEFLTYYALLKFINFSNNHIINIMRFYPNKHLLYDFNNCSIRNIEDE